MEIEGKNKLKFNSGKVVDLNIFKIFKNEDNNTFYRVIDLNHDTAWDDEWESDYITVPLEPEEIKYYEKYLLENCSVVSAKKRKKYMEKIEKCKDLIDVYCVDFQSKDQYKLDYYKAKIEYYKAKIEAKNIYKYK